MTTGVVVLFLGLRVKLLLTTFGILVTKTVKVSYSSNCKKLQAYCRTHVLDM